MRTLGPVTVDLAAGIVTLGGNSITLAREGDHFIAPGGLHARALRFEERSLVVAGALLEPEPNRALLVKSQVSPATAMNWPMPSSLPWPVAVNRLPTLQSVRAPPAVREALIGRAFRKAPQS